MAEGSKAQDGQTDKEVQRDDTRDAGMERCSRSERNGGVACVHQGASAAAGESGNMSY